MSFRLIFMIKIQTIRATEQYLVRAKSLLLGEAFVLADFGVQLRRILSQFPREQIHVIKFDDFKENTLKVYSETLVFLGLQA